MDQALQEIIKQKPHLADLIRFYEKTIRFMNTVTRSGAVAGPRMNAYRPEHLEQVFRHFSALFDLPEGTLFPLKQALEAGEIDFTRIPLLEVPAFSLPYSEDDLIVLLFLLSRPYFISMRAGVRLLDPLWEKGICPVCQGRPALASAQADERQKVWCSFCGNVGTPPRTSCMICDATDQAVSISVFDGEDGVKVQSCDACRSYVKIVDAAVFLSRGPELADIASLPVDIAVQQKGYQRRAPNPLGMLRMSVSG